MGVRISSSSLVSSVSNLGALGTIAAVGCAEGNDNHTKDYKTRSLDSFEALIKKTREKTSAPFAVNIMCALTNYDALADIAVQQKVDVIVSGAGLPLKLPALARGSGVKLVPIVSSGRAAGIICKTWKRRNNRLPDAIIVEGPLAGGHLGYRYEQLQDPAVCLEKIFAEVLTVTKEFSTGRKAIPVIAAGGIFTGGDIARFIRMGAAGVQMGTRFVATFECDAAPAFKASFLRARAEDVVIIQSPVGMPGRVIRNSFVERVLKGEKVHFDCPCKCLDTCDPSKAGYCIATVLSHAYRGEMDRGFAMCGSNVGRIDKIISVKELLDELVGEAQTGL